MRCFPLGIALLLSACPHAHDEHGHGHEHAHGTPEERPALSFTDWSAQTELFIELPALVQGHDSPCAAHVTTLAGFEPLGGGRVSVVLRAAGEEERFVADEPTVPGIFRPVVRPKASGRRTLVVEIASNDMSARHELGEVTVFASAAAARAGIPEEPAPAGRITFLKEQQWPIPFATEAANVRTLIPNLHVPGLLVARQDADLTIRAPLAGRIVISEHSFPRVGSRVAIGDALAVLAPRLEAADIASLELAVRSGELEIRYAASERQRLEALRQEGAVPERRVLEAAHEEESARAALASAQRRLSQFRRVESASGRGQGSVPLLAPLAGLVEEVLVAPGAFVETGAALFRVIDLTTLWVEAHVAELDVSALGGLQGASFTVSGRRWELGPEALAARSHALDPRTRTLSLWFVVDNAQGALTIGALAEVALQVGQPQSTLAVPETALVDDGGLAVVFVQVEGEAFERRIVRTSIRDRGYVAVERGVRAGEHVVTDGAYAVKLAASSGSVPAHGHAH